MKRIQRNERIELIMKRNERKDMNFLLEDKKIGTYID